MSAFHHQSQRPSQSPTEGIHLSPCRVFQRRSFVEKWENSSWEQQSSWVSNCDLCSHIKKSQPVLSCQKFESHLLLELKIAQKQLLSLWREVTLKNSIYMKHMSHWIWSSQIISKRELWLWQECPKWNLWLHTLLWRIFWMICALHAAHCTQFLGLVCSLTACKEMSVNHASENEHKQPKHFFSICTLKMTLLKCCTLVHSSSKKSISSSCFTSTWDPKKASNRFWGITVCTLNKDFFSNPKLLFFISLRIKSFKAWR